MRHFLLIVLVATSSPCQSQPVKRSTEKVSKTDEEKKKTPTPVPELPKPPIVATPPSQPTAKPNTTQAECQSQVPWRNYLCKAFAPATLASWILGLFAAIAAGISLRTLGVIAEQSRIARIGLEATRRAANAARSSATAAADSNKLAEDATDLTRQALILTHRPKLIALSFYLDGGSGPAFRAGSLAEGGFRIVNVGGTPAHVDEVYATAVIIGVLPMRPIPEGMSGRSVERPLAAGESIPWSFRKDDGAIIGGELLSLTSSRGDALRLYVCGFVKYTDEAEPPITRRTYFCRIFNREIDRFESVNNPDHEHAD